MEKNKSNGGLYFVIVPNDIRVVCVEAKSFPDGIIEAFQKLHSLIPASKGRRLFGISRPEKGVITYKAAAEEIKTGEAEQLNLESLVIRKGQYTSITITDYQLDVQSIGASFKQLLSSPGLDPNGYCVEWYLTDKDVRCMIRLKD